MASDNANDKSGVDEMRRERIAESVRAMKALYSVVSGFALSQGFLRLVKPVDVGGVQTVVFAGFYPNFAWLVALIVTIIPFHHGALRHLDNVYIYPDPKAPQPKKFAVLC